MWTKKINSASLLPTSGWKDLNDLIVVVSCPHEDSHASHRLFFLLTEPRSGKPVLGFGPALNQNNKQSSVGEWNALQVHPHATFILALFLFLLGVSE